MGPYEVYDYEEDEHVYRMDYNGLCEASTSDGSSIWYLEGDLATQSALTQVRVSKHGEMHITHHPSPPFPGITHMYVGPVSKRLLASAKQITHFLVKEKEPAVNE